MKKTLIYIIGAGRSGTTFLDIVLGNNGNAISLGEVNRFFKRKGLPPKRNELDKVFLFWNNIKKIIEQNLFTLDYKELEKIFKKNEYHSGFLKSLFKKNNEDYKKTLKLQYRELYNNIQENIVIESSKYPIRALNISNYINDEFFDIKFVYIRKDPVKVVASFGKKDIEQPTKGFFASNIYYLAINVLCFISINLLKKRGHNTSIIKYENLLENPTEVLMELSKKFDIDYKYLIDKLKNNSPLKTGFLFDGNRIRLKETVLLQTQKRDIKKNYKYYFIRIFNYLVYR